MKRLSLAAILLLMFCGLGFAQTNTGRLVGAVKGPDGTIAGAKVVIKDNQTGAEKTTVTTGEGTYSFPQLDFGTYTVTVEASGFKTSSTTLVKIDVGQEYSLNTTLQVGDVKETITVTANADVLNASTGELSNTVTPLQISELPLNGRDPTSLIQLQAGTSSNGATDTVINGQRTSFTNITLDGINVQDNFIRQNATDFLPIRPTTDNIGEFTVTTQNAGADQGNGASQVRLVTPRGQNAYHGTLFEYNRNNKFTANDFFNNANGVDNAKLNQNQFGGSFSGPAIKEKLFFFGYYEGLRLAQGTGKTQTILLPQARTGVFTYVDPTGKTQTTNVLSDAGFSGVDATVASRILANTPTVGNTSNAGDGLNTTGFAFNQSGGSVHNQYTTRVDFDINSKNSISGTYNYEHENNQRPDVDGGSGFGLQPIAFQPAGNRLLALSYRRTGSAFTNEVRGGFLRTDPSFQRTTGLPAFALSLPLISNPEVNFQPQGRNTNIYNIQDNAEYDRGQHSIKFGGELNMVRVLAFNSAGITPTVSLGTNINTISFKSTSTDSAGNKIFPNGISTTDLATANSLLGLLGGIVTGVGQTFNVASQTSGFVSGAQQSNQLNYNNIGIYGQDQWRVKPGLTFNYGVRWEYFSPVTEPDGKSLEPVIPSGESALQAVLDPNGTYNFVGGNSGGHRFSKPDYKQFSPILSFAYSPSPKGALLSKFFGESGKTVIRGGYRMSYVNDELIVSAFNALGGNAGLIQSANAINPNTGTTALNARLSSVPNVTPPAFQVPRTFAQNDTAQFNFFGTVFGLDPNIHAPRTNEVNFGIQREVGANSAIEIRYVGGWSNSLVRTLDFNQVDITSNGFLADFNRALSNLNLTGSAAFNSALPGSQPLTVFPNLAGGGLLTNSTIINAIKAGTPADLAIIYVQNGLAGSVKFLPNLSTGVADVLFNGGKYRYNSLQAEFRHRFSKGLLLQANYTYQKNLTNAQDSQALVASALDNNQLGLEYTRATSDQTHVFNLNGIYELPFGAGKRFLNQSGIVDRVFGGWQLTSIIRASSGAPINITDTLGTLNRSGRSGAQTPTLAPGITPDQIKNLIGVFTTPKGVFFFNPTVGITSSNGRAALGFGVTPFAGQIFLENQPGTTGNLGRNIFSGPTFFNWDSSLIKNIKIKESMRIQFRAEAFNTINNVNFFVSPSGNFNINSTQFGKITQDFNPRIMQFALRFYF